MSDLLLIVSFVATGLFILFVAQGVKIAMEGNSLLREKVDKLDHRLTEIQIIAIDNQYDIERLKGDDLASEYFPDDDDSDDLDAEPEHVVAPIVHRPESHAYASHPEASTFPWGY